MDKEYIDGLFDMDKEVHLIIEHFNQRATEVSGKDALIALKIEQNTALIDALKNQRRILAFWQGKPIEPVVHFGEAVLLPVGGMG